MRLTSILSVLLCLCGTAIGEHQHGSEGPKLSPPKVFLDKSPRVVAYQLKRLDNQRLLMVQRQSDDQKFIPVYTAILSRPGISPQFQEEAVGALVRLNDSDPVTELINAIEKFDDRDRDQRRTGRQLANRLLNLPVEQIRSKSKTLNETLGSDHDLVRAVAAAGLIVAGQAESLISSPATRGAFLSAIPLIPDQATRDAQFNAVVTILNESQSSDEKKNAITALGSISSEPAQAYQSLAPLVAEPSYRDEAVKSILTIPGDQRDDQISAELLARLVDHAEQTPAKDRTSDAFVDAMQLADQLMAGIAPNIAKEYRLRLEAVTVRVVRIKTVDEEMRYDLPYFAVQAGKPVQIILANEDLMPHNLVITTPQSLKEVAQLGLEAGPRGIDGGLPYVPKSDKVLHATNMVAAHQQARLTFTAPLEPGEYPYVCTFPQHWYRMYGVMVVVENLDRWNENPIEPANPIGSNRSFVNAWSVDDLKGELELGLQGRSAEIGKRLFIEASCQGCHKMHGEGGAIGPDLSDLAKRWKGDRVGVLREVLDPSHRVDAKYAMQRVLTVDGQIINGILMKEDDDAITLVVSPDAKEPTVIAQDDIEQMSPSSTSIMPKALLDQYTKDEIFELLSYLEGR